MSASRSVSKNPPESKVSRSYDYAYPPFHPVILGDRSPWRKIADLLKGGTR